MMPLLILELEERDYWIRMPGDVVVRDSVMWRGTSYRLQRKFYGRRYAWVREDHSLTISFERNRYEQV